MKWIYDLLTSYDGTGLGLRLASSFHNLKPGSTYSRKLRASCAGYGEAPTARALPNRVASCYLTVNQLADPSSAYLRGFHIRCRWGRWESKRRFNTLKFYALKRLPSSKASVSGNSSTLQSGAQADYCAPSVDNRYKLQKSLASRTWQR
jgi:hypothetical protein